MNPISIRKSLCSLDFSGHDVRDFFERLASAGVEVICRGFVPVLPPISPNALGRVDALHLLKEMAKSAGAQIFWKHKGTLVVMLRNAEERRRTKILEDLALTQDVSRLNAIRRAKKTLDIRVMERLAILIQNIPAGGRLEREMGLCLKDQCVYFAAIEREVALKCLEWLAQSQEVLLRRVAAEGLGYVDDARLMLLLEKMSGDQEASVRVAVAQSLGRIGGKKAHKLLAQLAKDPDEEVRCAVAIAFARQRGRGSEKWLKILALDQDHPMVACAAVYGLATYGGEENAPLLIEIATQQVRLVRFEVIAALRKVGGCEAFLFLRDETSKWFDDDLCEAAKYATVDLATRGCADADMQNIEGVLPESEEKKFGVLEEENLGLFLEKLAREPDAELYAACKKEEFFRRSRGWVAKWVEDSEKKCSSHFCKTMMLGMFLLSKKKRLAIAQLLEEGGAFLIFYALDMLAADSSVRLRRFAVAFLSRIGGRRALSILERMVLDTDASVRQSVTKALEEIGGERALAILKRMRGVSSGRQSPLDDERVFAMLEGLSCSSSSWHQGYAMEVLGSIGGEKAIVLLEKMCLNPKTSLPGRALAAIAKIGGDMATACIEKMAEHTSSSIRSDAIEALRKMGKLNAIQVLEKMSLSEDRQKRLYAAELLGNTWSTDASSLMSMVKQMGESKKAIAQAARDGREEALLLLEKMMSDADAAVREAVLRALNAMGGKRAYALLETMAFSDPSVDVRAFAVYRLGRIGGKKLFSLLARLSRDPEAKIREHVASTLGWMKEEKNFDAERASVLELLEKMAGDQEPTVRGSVAHAVGNILEKDSLPILSKMALDPEPKVRACVVSALESIQEDASFDILKKMINDKDEDVRSALAFALGMREEKALPYLAKLARDVSGWVRHRAVMGLMGIRGEKALEILIQTLLSPDISPYIYMPPYLEKEGFLDALEKKSVSPDKFIRHRVACILGQIGGDGARAILQKMYATSDAFVFLSVQSALRRVEKKGE